jgi:hypothetical protein
MSLVAQQEGRELERDEQLTPAHTYRTMHAERHAFVCLKIELRRRRQTRSEAGGLRPSGHMTQRLPVFQ